MWTYDGVSWSHFLNWTIGWSRGLSCGPLVRGDFRRANPWNYTVWQYENLSGTERIVGPGSYRFEQSGIIGSTYTAVPDVYHAETAAYDQALTRLNEKLRGSLDLAVSAAEGRQTYRMLNLVERYSSFVLSLRRSFLREIWANHFANKRRKLTASHLRRWQNGIKHRFGSRNYKPIPVNRGLVSRVTARGANGWLEFTYGFTPLISDIRGIAENIIGVVRNAYFTLKGVGKHDLRERSKIAGPSGHVGVANVSGFTKVTLGVQMRPGFDSSLARWTSLNPFTVAYELIPYSFVFDWIYDLGGYMRNLETSLLYQGEFVQGYRSTLTRWTSTTEFAGTVKTSPWATSQLNAACRYSSTSFVRTVLTQYPYPQLPKLNLNLGSSRLLSAASLLRQRLKI